MSSKLSAGASSAGTSAAPIGAASGACSSARARPRRPRTQRPRPQPPRPRRPPRRRSRRRPSAGGAAGPAGAAASPLVLALLLAFRARVLGEERLPVGDRDLVIVGMDFAEGEKAVPVPAIFDERRLKRRFDPRHLGEIDVPAKLSPRSGFEVELLDLLTAHHHHPRLLRVGGIDKHLVCHDELSTWRSPTALLARRPTRARGAIHVAASMPEAARWFGGCRRSPSRARWGRAWG